MKRYFGALLLLPALLIALPLARAADDDIIVGDDDGTGILSSVTLAWNPNSEPDLAGYYVYYGRDSGDYVRIVSVAVPTATIKVRGNKTIYFAATAYDTSGEESDFSNEVHYP
jgi:hypothetical protein